MPERRPPQAISPDAPERHEGERPLPPRERTRYGLPLERDAMKILLIEDDKEAAEYLVKALTESGYVVDHAADGRDGLFLATSGTYDALIVDRMLPGMDGLSVIGALRAADVRTPALILSALGAVD